MYTTGMLQLKKKIKKAVSTFTGNDHHKFVFIYIYTCIELFVCLLLFFEDMLPCIISGPYSKWH